jgi:pathogenesis-related protein 1
MLHYCIILLFSYIYVSTAFPLPFSPDLYQISLIAAHNTIRAVHGAPPLVWSYPLAEMASKWANQCMFENTGGSLSTQPYGENIAAGTGDFTPDAAVALFIQDECKSTDLVWRDVSDVIDSSI